MSITGQKIKITQSRSDNKSIKSMRYNVSYGVNKSEEQQKKNSHSIISALKGNNSVLVDVNSSLFNLLQGQRDSFALSFLDYVRSAGLKYRYRKAQDTGNQSFISKLFSANKASDMHQIVCHIPDDIWNSTDFIYTLPFYGVRYCICNEGTDMEQLINDIYNGQLLESEENSFYRHIIFDSCSYGNMGIYTDILSLEEIKRLTLA